MTIAPPSSTNGQATKRPSKAPKPAPKPAMPRSLSDRIPVRKGDYVPRVLGTEQTPTGPQDVTDLHVMAIAHAENKKPTTLRKKNIMLLGDTGTGKTELVMEYAGRMGMPVITVMPALRPEHLIGQFIETETGSLVWQKGPLWVAAEIGNCLLYLDEINRLHEDVVPLLYPLLDTRRSLVVYEHAVRAIRRSTGEYLNHFDPNDPDQERWEGELIIPLPDDVLIVASYNPGYAGTAQLNEALRNRFEVSLVFDYDDKVEAGVITCEPIRRMGKALRDQSLTHGRITVPITTNQLRAFQENIATFGLSVATRMFLSYFDDEDERKIVQGVLDTKYMAEIRKHFGYSLR